MRVAALRVELHLPLPQSLKEKRSVLRPVIEGLRRLGSYSVAEVGHHDSWQRATIGVAIVAPDGPSLHAHVGKVRAYLDSRPGVEIVDFFESELDRPE
jgi:hypothetical protein